MYKTVPHITLKSIANNEPPSSETLYDSPEIDRTRIRMTGPFTVEALPAPVVLSPDEAANLPEDFNEGAKQSDWREQLLATGILGRNGERIRFRRVEEFHGSGYLHAEGETDEERPRKVIVSFAGETSLMDTRKVSLALDEAETVMPRPELVVFAAFQFDPEASGVIAGIKWPGVELLQVQMNPDLMTLDLRKNVRTDQSFYLVGQPDVELERLKGGKCRVRVLGFDYFNINTNKVESGNSDKIAMWLLDVNYDGMTLRPSQVFFPMEGRSGGWVRLARTLRAEIDEGMIMKFAGCESLEFDVPSGGKVAVKIIDDRGIESMRVLKLGETN